MTTPVRMGLVGYGSGGRVFHAPFLASAPEVEFLGVATRDPQRQAQVVADHPGARAFADLRALAEAGAEVVAISTPFDTRVPLAREAIALGLAVVCDKPFAPDAAAAAALVEEAERAGVLLTVYQNRRADSDFRTMRRLLEAGELGEPLRLESRFERFRPGTGPGRAGGGVLLDLGSHLVDQALQLLGPVATVHGDVHVGPDGLDDDWTASLVHASGARSLLLASSRQPAPGPRFRLAGTTGGYVVGEGGAIDGQEAALKAGRSPATEGESWGVEPSSAWGRLHRGDEGVPVPSERGRWDAFYPAVAAAVRGEGSLPVDPRDAVAALEVVDAVRASAREGRVVALAQPAGQP